MLVVTVLKKNLAVVGVFVATLFGLYYFTRPKPPKLSPDEIALSDGTVLKFPPLPKYEKPEDKWIKKPPVFCPEGKTCKVWRLDHSINEHLALYPQGIDVIGLQCAADPAGGKNRGRIIAVDPNDYRIAFVSLRDGC